MRALLPSGIVRWLHIRLQIVFDTTDGRRVPLRGSADLLPHVFDLFSQGRGSTQLSHTGLGIGLWLVKKLLEMHQGRIEACSPGAGQGSTFVVRPPLAGA